MSITHQPGPKHTVPAYLESGNAVHAMWVATEPIHDQQVAQMQWLRDITSFDAYGDVLDGFYGFHAAAEAALAPADWSPTGWVPAEHSRLPSLLADLTDLHRDGDIPTIHWCELPSATSIAEAIGIAFVLEGSRHGGRVMAKWLSEALPAAPIRFFEEDGRSVKWREFSAATDKTLHTLHDRQVAVDTSVRLMEEFLHWSASWEHPA